MRGSRTTAIGAATVALLTGVLLAAPTALATNYHVTRTDDPAPDPCIANDCSLREAILAANDRQGADTVRVRGGTSYELALTGAREDVGLTGDLDVTGKLAVEARGEGRATIDANGVDRVLETLKPITLVGLVLTGGDVTVGGEGSAGGIEASAPTRVISSELIQNTGSGAALNGGGRVVHSVISGNVGGGVSALGGPLLLSHSRVEGNSGNRGDGGGVQANRATIDHSKILGNAAPTNCGGASLSGDSITIRNSVFDGNRTDGDGGGLCVGNFSEDLEIVNSRFTENTAFGTGGGLSLRFITGSLSEVSVSGNDSGGDGGGVRLAGSHVKMTRSTIDHNLSGGAGAGMNVSGPGEVRLINATVTSNEAAGPGGGIDLDSPGGGVAHARLVFSTITSNVANTAIAGGDTGGGGIKLGTNAAYDEVRGSLIALNSVVVAPGPTLVGNDCVAAGTSAGHNLIGFETGCDGFDGPGDLVKPNPRLGTLSDHGGPTETIPLLGGSPAIDAGGKSGPKTDQRGVRRPQGRRYDVGAFERRGG
jgi:CSLREA domain-containing protein